MYKIVVNWHNNDMLHHSTEYAQCLDKTDKIRIAIFYCCFHVPVKIRIAIFYSGFEVPVLFVGH